MTRRPRLAITLGDPCGIGPELLVRTLPGLIRQAEVTVVGTWQGLDILPPRPDAAWTRRGDRIEVTFQGQRGEALWIETGCAPGALAPGRLCAEGGRCALEAVQVGARRVLQGLEEALVTFPLHKGAVHLAGHDIPGHTEVLRDLAGVPEVRMAFASPTLNVVLHTVHQSLRSVIDTLDAQAVAATLAFTARHMAPLLGRRPLRVALAALNPHAGEGGAFGTEEQILEAALALARSQALPDVVFTGPHPADSLFLRAWEGHHDVVVALYHDQGLIPLKLMEPTRAVNLTLGLPFVRTSPDHGTAFDIAGQWRAEAANAQAALDLALRLVRPGVVA